MNPFEMVSREIDYENIKKHLYYLERNEKLSGSIEAEDAAHYILSELKKEGVPCHMEEFEAFLSNPKTAELLVWSKEEASAISIHCRPRAFSKNCEIEIEGELLYDDGERNDEAFWEDVKGKIVVSYGYDEVYALQLGRYGALGWIQVWPSDEQLIHEDTAGAVWGTPTTDSMLLLPTIPIIGITKENGEKLISMIQTATVVAKLKSTVDEAVRHVLMPVAEIPGESDEFVLMSCHYDTWYHGAVDNCAANASAIEMARLFWKKRDELKRGIKIVWWAGHSNGRYAGSTWFCDTHWFELHEKCVAHITSDLTGCKSGKIVGYHTTGAEGIRFMEEIVESFDKTRIKEMRIGRGADQSFWGTGIPLHFYSRYIPEEKDMKYSTPGQGVYWWHTEADQIDKIDESVHLKDAKLFFLSGYRLATEEQLPFSVETYFEKVDRVLEDSEMQSDPCFDYHELRDAVAELRNDTERAMRSIQDVKGRNRIVRIVAGGMNRLMQTSGSPFSHDLAITATPAFPRLCHVKNQSRNQMSEKEYLFMKTDFIRQSNRMFFEIKRMQQEITYVLTQYDEKGKKQ